MEKCRHLGGTYFNRGVGFCNECHEHNGKMVNSPVDCAHGVPMNLDCGVCEVEKDPNGISPHEGGAKLDAGKSPVLQGFMNYFPLAISAVSDVSGFGARKYTWGGWRSVEDGENRYGDALMRHIIYESHGPLDKDSGLLHAAHAAWNAMARLELMLRKEMENG